MRSLSIPAKKVWLFIGLSILGSLLAITLFFVVLGGVFGRSPAMEFAIVKKAGNPKELQSWALELVRDYPSGTNGLLYDHRISNRGRLVFTNAPPSLKHLPAFGAVGPEILVSGLSNCVEIVYFYGGWGNGQSIVLGSPSFSLPTNSRCFRWAPGVYYRVF